MSCNLAAVVAGIVLSAAFNNVEAVVSLTIIAALTVAVENTR